MKKFFFVFLILSVFFSGCSWFSSKKSSRRVNPDDLVVKLEEKETVVVDGSLEEGNIVDREKLKEGGNVAVIPFSPGANIEANEEFDRVTLRMIRGIAEEFSADTSKFTLLSSDNAGEADFILEGRVVEFQKPSMMKTVTLKNSRYRIVVQGKLIDRDTEKAVFVFSDTVQAKNKKETLEVLGLKIGHHIGRFMTTGGSAK